MSPTIRICRQGGGEESGGEGDAAEGVQDNSKLACAICVGWGYILFI